MNKLIISLLLLASVTLVKSNVTKWGDPTDRELIHKKTVKYSEFPSMSITKNMFYKDERKRVITAILAKDNLRSKARASITTGGVGHAYVNIRLDSEKGKGLNFNIEIYS